MNCINCGTEVSSKYCPNCGQSNPPRKITVGHMWSDFQARVYGFDGMFPRTLTDLTLRPAQAARLFIEGNRIQYYGPVGYFFLMITVMLLIMSLMDVNVVDFLKSAGKFGMQQPPKAGSGMEKFMQSVFQFASDNIKLLSFALIPLQALSARYLFFRKSSLNFLEHTVLPFYVQGHIYWLSILSVLYYKVAGSFFPPSISFVLAPLYFAFAYSGMFTYQSRVKGFFKGLGIYFTAQVIFSLIIALSVIVLVVFNPEIRELIKPSNNR